MDNIKFETIIGFECDHGNFFKNQVKHKTTPIECEEVFFNIPLLLYNDLKHSIAETRFYVLGQTNNERKLFIAFTIRNNHIRIISARDMNKKEQLIYEKAKTTTKI